MLKTRNHTIDIAKGIGIFLVVLGHNWIVSHNNREIFRIIFSFHMPLFLFLSGIFLNENITFREFAISRGHSLLKPYLTTLTALGLIKLFSDLLNNRNYLVNFLGYIEGVFYGTGRTIAWPPLWYLPHLFVVSCSTLLIIRLIASNKLKLLISVILLSTGVFLINPIDLPWSIDLLPISIAFFMTGYQCRTLIKAMEFNIVYLMLSLALFFLLHYFFNDTIDLNFRIYDSLIISTLQAMLGIYICLSLSSYLAHYVLAARILGYIGSGTLFILLFHAYIQDKSFGLLAKLLGESTLTAIFSLLIGVVVPLILWELSKRSYYFSALFLPKISISRASRISSV
jgi:fucose 4-O-acetylase-like acetyltransferase